MILGVDIGATGALALLSPDGALVSVADMPCLLDGPAGRRAVNAALLADVVRRFAPITAYVEHVGARPGEAASGAFAFGPLAVRHGESRGQPRRHRHHDSAHRLEAACRDRAGSREQGFRPCGRHRPLAGARRAVSRKGDVDRAEAALIAVAGIARKERS